MQRCITVPNRPCFLTTRERSETGVMNPNSHSSCTSLSQNVTRSLESNFQIGSHITIGQETFQGGSARGTRSEGWHRAQSPGVPALKEPAQAVQAGARACAGSQSARERRGKEGQQDMPKAQLTAVGWTGGIMCSPSFLCSDGLC